VHTVNMHEAKSQLSKLVERALAGETVVIARSGVPAVRLVPTHPNEGERRPGVLRGQIRIAPDFDQTPEMVFTDFEGE
jgi:prevent-host-death family protein